MMDLAHHTEWEQYPPDLRNDLIISQPPPPKEVIKEKEENPTDLTMEFFMHDRASNRIRNICVSSYTKHDDHVTYTVEVHVQELSWVVNRRYREFYKLHEELVEFYKVPWELLPPKKMVGNLDPQHLEKRRSLLERYLKKVINLLRNLPCVLEQFLEIDQFDVHTVCEQLARDLYTIGEDLLARNLVFKITPLQMHCINRRLQLPLIKDGGTDIAHLYSFIYQVKQVLVYPGVLNNVLAGQTDLQYDISLFKSLKYLEMHQCDIELLGGIDFLQENLVEVRIFQSIQLIKDFVISSSLWSQGILMSVSEGKEDLLTNQFRKWTALKKATFSYNKLISLDYSLTLLVSLEYLDLSHNELTEVHSLDELLRLNYLDLSFNKFRHIEDFAYKLPGVSVLRIAGNRLTSIKGLEKLCSLNLLDISYNKLEQVGDIALLRRLPLLDALCVQKNPFTKLPLYKERIWSLFPESEITIDDMLPTKKEEAKIRELVEAEENYALIEEPELLLLSDPPSADIVPPKKFLPQSCGVRPPQASPRVKKKDRIANIAPAKSKKTGTDCCEDLGNEEDTFRDQIENLREHAGDSWLTFYNEMADPTKNVSTEEKKNDEVPSEEQLNEQKKRSESGPSTENPLISIEQIDLEVNDDLRAAIKQLLNQQTDLYNETFLVTTTNDSENMIAVDIEKRTLIEINLETGATLQSYRTDTIRSLAVEENNSLRFESKTTDSNEHTLVRLRPQSVKDAAGLYIVLKSYAEPRHRYSSSNSAKIVSQQMLQENPFEIPHPLLIAFLQDFIRRTKQNKKPTLSRYVSTNSNYENLDIGQSFLQHQRTESNIQQDMVTVVWVGCLPYLFPDDEIPVCLTITNLNIFLFRVFLPENDAKGETLKNEAGLREAMHCFYSFPLTRLREIVVGMFDQGLRIEVENEGARGTFVLLTRDASKTSHLLDTINIVLDDESSRPSIVYPDEKKIEALKFQLNEQQLTPLQDRENLISYCIVYERRPGEDNNTTQLAYDESSLPYLRSLVLTNARLFLCDEDYVHWPLPTYVYSTPLTPQWIVDDVEKVADLIAVNVWEDMRGKYSLTGCYGITMTFETVNHENVWNLLFQSSAERQQFVRSVTCLWKNCFDRDLKITYCQDQQREKTTTTLKKGHHRNASGVNTAITTPAILAALDRPRINQVYRGHIAKDEDQRVEYVLNVGCLTTGQPSTEIPVALILGSTHVYIVCGEEHQNDLQTKYSFCDQNSDTPLFVTAINIQELKQVVVGLFDQCFRLETDTLLLVFITRNFDHTNDFVQRLSQVILNQSPRLSQVISETPETLGKDVYSNNKNPREDAYPRTEFVHPNSDTRFVYPSDEGLEKLRYDITTFVRVNLPHKKFDDNFGVVSYSLLFYRDNETFLPYTLVLSEGFACIIKEDNVNFPLPLFATECPANPQYEVCGAILIPSVVRLEFDEFHSGDFSIVYDATYEERNSEDHEEEEESECYESKTIETGIGEVCLVETQEEENEDTTKQFSMWCLKTVSYADREKLFGVITKMWSDRHHGNNLPVVKTKTTF